MSRSAECSKAIKVYDYTSMFFHHFTKGNNCSNFLFASLSEVALPNWGLLLKERTCSWKSKFFPLRVDHIEKGGKIENGRVASPKSVPIHLNDNA